MNEWQAVELVGFLTRSKAIWNNPALLNLVESAPSPTKAYALVLKNTGSQRKAKAGRWYACAIRDFGKAQLGGLVAVLKSSQGAEKLEELLTTTSLKMGQEKGTEMNVKTIRDLVGIPVKASDYYNKETLPQCKIHTETDNFIVFLWNKGYYGQGGDCSYVWIYIVHKQSQKWCKLIELDQTMGGTSYRFDEIKDIGKALDVMISGHCEGDYTTTVDYDRDIFEARLSSDSSKLEVFRKENPVVEEEERIATEKKLAQARDGAMKMVIAALKSAKISEANMQALVEYTMAGNYWNCLKVVSEDLVICDGKRDMYSGTSGVGKFCQIHVWYKGQADMQEWQWRDCYSADRDRHDFYINGIGNVTTSSKGSQVEIRIKLLNKDHGPRYTTFIFKDKDAVANPTISKEKQAEFARRFEAEIQRVLGGLEEMWTRKDSMLTNHGPQKYRRPSIKQRVLNTPNGIGAFVTEEQIDHRTGGDPQVRFELFLMKAGDTEAKCVLEDHSYEKSDGIRVISILGLTSNQLTASTHDGSKTIKVG